MRYEGFDCIGVHKRASDLDKKQPRSPTSAPLQIPDMFTNNPYAQGGWRNPQNPHPINQSPWRPNSSHPPTFGALQVPNLNEKTASVLTFEFLPYVLPPKDGKSRLDVACLCTPGQSLPICSVLPQPVADGKMSPPTEASSAHSTLSPPCHGTIPDQSTTIGISQDSRPVSPPQHPLPQSLPKVSFDLFNSL